MNIRNFHKYFSDFIVQTSTNKKDSFGAIIVGSQTSTIRGYLWKKVTSTLDRDNIPVTLSNGILFTDPEVLLTTGDIINHNFIVMDFDKHPSHNEYSIKLVDKYGKRTGSLTPPADDKYNLLLENGDPIQTESGLQLLMEGA